MKEKKIKKEEKNHKSITMVLHVSMKEGKIKYFSLLSLFSFLSYLHVVP
jgi:hypothetical protein